ncbi:MAG: GAF domain-containing sensor histidine kinase [Spirochaetes bacterium]|nr:GAF domain-containing sensor histidine kinase [Spirochaetota bacterium]
MKEDNCGAIEYIPGGEPLRTEEGFTEGEERILDYINRKIAAGNSLREIIDFLFETIQPLVPCDRIGVSFIEEQGLRMTLYYVAANYKPLYLDAGYGADLAGSSLNKIFESGAMRILNDLECYSRDHPSSESTLLLIQEGILSSATCPLRVEERPVGLLFFSSKRRRAYSRRELAMHAAVSERLSQAVEKAYRIEQLSESINSYMDMLGFVTHELKSPLDSLIIMGNTLLQGYFGEVPERAEETIRRMVKRADQLSEMVHQYLNLSRFETGSVKKVFRDADIMGEAIIPAIESIEPQMHERGMTLERNHPESAGTVFCDPSLIRIVVANLLSNAVKYGNEGGAIRITVTRAEEKFQCTVWNEGPGFPESEKKKLFRKFSRLESPELMKRKGTGIGLYTSWKIIRLHDGRIRGTSEEGRWAEFTFEIPA